MFLLEESTLTEIPDFAGNIFRNFDKKTASQADLLFALTYCIALESGFYPVTPSDSEDLIVSSLYAYNFSNILKISQTGFPTHLSCVDEEFYRIEVQCPMYEKPSNENLCLTSVLSGVKSSDSLIVTMTVGTLPGGSVSLPLSRYILATSKKEFPYRLRNLKDLSKILKDEVFVPIRNTLIAEYSSGSLVYPGLQGLPFDIVVYILKFLKSRKDLQNLSKTCKMLRDICKDEHFRRRNK